MTASNIDAAKLAELVERLRRSAHSESDFSRKMAEAKSLRQHDCDPPRADLYMWLKPEDTDSWKAADALESLTDTRGEDMRALGTALQSVWIQAEDNHRQHSDTGDRENDIRFLTLGLTGEGGEIMEAVLDAALVVQASGKVANLVKKRWRDGDGHDEAIRFEIADVCAYAFMLANTMGLSPADLIETIAEKQRVFVEKMRTKAIRALPVDDEGVGR